MGKIRVKTLGIEEEEKKQVLEAKKRQEAKEAKKKAKGAHGGSGLVSMSPTEEELEKDVAKEPEETHKNSEEFSGQAKEPEGKDKKRESKELKSNKGPRKRSKRYTSLSFDRDKKYAIPSAVEVLKKISGVGFDATVELHINTTEKGIHGQVSLPHGTGKTVRVAIANPSAPNGASGQVPLDKLIENIEKGVIEFDVLVAHPGSMPKLAKVAKILGPRGLMPNPKSGTISDKPEELAKKFMGGQTNFRTEAQSPIIHAVIGKVSFKEKDLSENIGEFLKAIGKNKMTSVTLKSTMSPGIRLDISTL